MIANVAKSRLFCLFACQLAELGFGQLVVKRADFVFDGHAGEKRGLADTEPLLGLELMVLDRPARHAEDGCDLVAGAAEAGESHDFALSRAERSDTGFHEVRHRSRLA